MGVSAAGAPPQGSNPAGVGSDIQTIEIDDNAVTLAKVAHGSPNASQGFDNAGAPSEVPGLPIGHIGHFNKSFKTISSGNADTNTVDKLIDSGADFVSDGVAAGDYVFNSTDSTWAIIDVVDNLTTLSLRADIRGGSVVTDVFPLGSEAYAITNTPELLPGLVELNGQTLSGGLAESSSRWNGEAMPDVNGDNRFLRSDITSKGEGGAEAHNHKFINYVSGSNYTAFRANGSTATVNLYKTVSNSNSNVNAADLQDGSADLYTENKTILPKYYAAVAYMRIY